MDLPGLTVERRRGFSEQESLQEMDVQMFLEALLAHPLPLVALGCLWERSVAPSSGMEQHPAVPVLPHRFFHVLSCVSAAPQLHS